MAVCDRHLVTAFPAARRTDSTVSVFIRAQTGTMKVSEDPVCRAPAGLRWATCNNRVDV